LVEERQHSDLIVVSIVVLFLVAVMVLEALEKLGSLKNLFTRRRRRGVIYLDDDATDSFSKKPFILQPAPLPRMKATPSPSIVGEKKLSVS